MIQPLRSLPRSEDIVLSSSHSSSRCGVVSEERKPRRSYKAPDKAKAVLITAGDAMLVVTSCQSRIQGLGLQEQWNLSHPGSIFCRSHETHKSQLLHKRLGAVNS